MPKRRLISFDWAMKKLLRSKANFEILEGFLSELLKDNIRILDLKLPEQERLAYENYQEDLHYQASMLESSYTIALRKGEKRGKEEGEILGEKKKATEIADNLLKAGGMDIKAIADMTGLTPEEVVASKTVRSECGDKNQKIVVKNDRPAQT